MTKFLKLFALISLVSIQINAGVCTIGPEVELIESDKKVLSYKLHKDSTSEKLGLTFSKCAQLAKKASQMGLKRAKKEKIKISEVQTQYSYEELGSPKIEGQVKLKTKRVL